ncbi:MAG: hypothetical protein LUD72_04715 [Bacteroidales bacterium]|nr:hypothetical protein [Bacteroidales bacterium]
MAGSEGSRETKKYMVDVSESELRYIMKMLGEKPRGTTLARLLLDAVYGRPENDEDPVEKIYESMCGTEARLKDFLDNHKSVYDEAAEFIDIVNACLREYSVLLSAARGNRTPHG